MSSDCRSRRGAPCLWTQNWHSYRPTATFGPSAGNRARLYERKATRRRVPESRSRLFQAEQTQSNPPRLTHAFSVGYTKNGRIKPIEVNCHCFNWLDVKSNRFLRFLNEAPAINELQGKTNPIKPIEVINLVFNNISQKWANQTHGVYLPPLQRLTTTFCPDFAIFGCPRILPSLNAVSYRRRDRSRSGLGTAAGRKAQAKEDRSAARLKNLRPWALYAIR